MGIILKLKRGTTVKNNSYTGLDGEVTVDSDKDVLVVHDGGTPGGSPLATEAQMNTAISEGNSVLPSVFLEADSLDNWLGKTDERLAKFAYRGGGLSLDGYIKMKPQGTSSLEFDKKNFTLTFYTDESYSSKKKVVIRDAWGAQSKYVIKADWIDPTHTCNVVTAQLAGDISKAFDIFPGAPNGGCIDGFPVTVYGNGGYIGIYNFNIPKDGWMAGPAFNESDESMILGTEVQDGAGAFRALADFDTSFESEHGDDDADALAAFNRLVEFVKDANDTDFKANLADYLNLDAALNYYCLCYFSAAIDNLGKNMLMMTEDRLEWFTILYDLDSLWGVGLDGQTVIDYDVLCPDWYQCSTSLLWEKLERNFGAELAARYAELRQGPLSCASLAERFIKYANKIEPQLLEKEIVRWPGMDVMIRTVDGMISWIYKRARFVDFAMGEWQAQPSASLGTKLLDLSSQAFAGDGQVNNTGIKLYDVKEKDWTLIIKMPNTVLDTGYRAIATCGNDGHGVVIKREYTDNNEVFVSVGNQQVIRLPASALSESVIAVVKSDGAYRVYRDGVQYGKVRNRAYMPNLWNGPLYLGGSGNETGTETWWGNTPMTITKAVVHNKALNAADIAGYVF